MIPNNGRVLGGGNVEETAETKVAKRGVIIPEEEPEDLGDQFEQEEKGGGNLPPTPIQKSHEGHGEAKRTQDVQGVMSDLMGSDMANLRVTNISLDLNGTQKLKISFGKEKGRMITLYVDGTWKYEA